MSRYMMKLTRILLLSLVISFCFIGCGQKSDDNDMAEMINTRVDQELSQDAEDMLEKKGYVIVDVRPQEEYDIAHVEEAICIPLDTISDTQPKELADLDQIIMLYGRTSRDSAEATHKLQEIGYNYVYDLGGVMDQEMSSESETREEKSKTSNGSAGGKLPSSNGAGKNKDSDYGKGTGAPDWQRVRHPVISDGKCRQYRFCRRYLPCCMGCGAV